jgi:hypothetical protein
MLPDDIPLYRSPQYESLDPDDLRRWLSTVRAANAWYADGRPDVIRRRLLDELEFNDDFASWRLRRVSTDLAAAQDWTEASRRRSWVELERLRRYEDAAS